GILVKVHRLDLTPRLVSTDRARHVRGRTRSRGRYRVREIVGVQAELASEGHRVAHRRENGRHVLDDLLAHGRGREVDRHGERFDLDGHDGTARSESDTSATSTLPRLSIRRCSSASFEITQSPRKSPPMVSCKIAPASRASRSFLISSRGLMPSAASSRIESETVSSDGPTNSGTGLRPITACSSNRGSPVRWNPLNVRTFSVEAS